MSYVFDKIRYDLLFRKVVTFIKSILSSGLQEPELHSRSVNILLLKNFYYLKFRFIKKEVDQIVYQEIASRKQQTIHEFLRLYASNFQCFTHLSKIYLNDWFDNYRHTKEVYLIYIEFAVLVDSTFLLILNYGI